MVDASVALSWFFEDEVDDFANATAARALAESIAAPSIFPAEIANGLLWACARQRIGHADVVEALVKASKLPVQIEAPSFELLGELDIARRHKLSIYDAMYVAVAKSRNLTLATRDKRLAQAARREKVSVEFPRD